MRNLCRYQIYGVRFFLLFLLSGILSAAPQLRSSDSLPFDPAEICRYSIDNIPRSLSIRQGADVWFGYDLEQARVFKVWRAPADKPGVVVNSFKAQSSGTALFEGKAGEGWQIKIDGKSIPLIPRYLGSTEQEGNFELRWELSHPAGTITLSERIPKTKAPDRSEPYRLVRIESLAPGVLLVLPEMYRETWVLTDPEGKTVSTFTGPDWHQLSLP